jgi:hypothetical protein
MHPTNHTTFPNPNLTNGQRRQILPILEGKVLRHVADRSKGSEIGYVICPRTNVAIKTESKGEQDGVLYCYMDPAVERVMAQSARIWFTDAEGARRHHTLDVRAKRYDGVIHGLLFKPDSKAVESDLRTFTKMLAAVTPKEVANTLNYVTDRDLPEYGLSNAAAMLSCRRESRTEVDAALAELAPGIEGDISIADLCVALGGGRIAFRPVMRAIFYGTLVCVSEGLIDPSTIVRFSGIVMPDLDADGPIQVRGLERVNGAPPQPAKPKPGHKNHSYRAS